MVILHRGFQQGVTSFPQVSTGSYLLGPCVSLPPWKLSQGQCLKVEPAQTSLEGTVNMLNVSQGGSYTRHTKLLVPGSTDLKIIAPFKSEEKPGERHLLAGCCPEPPHPLWDEEATEGLVFPADKEHPKSSQAEAKKHGTDI